MAILTDGRTGDSVRITSNNKMQTSTVSEPLSDYAAQFGQKFNINTGDITLTNATKTSVLYIQNNSNDPIVVTSIIYNLGATASGTGDVLIEVIRNPKTGAIITNANNVAIGAGVEANQNFGRTDIIDGLIYKGATGEAVFSDGDVTITTRSASNTGRIFLDLGVLDIPKGGSLGINYTPPTSNTSQICQFAVPCYVKTSLVSEEA